MLRAGAFEARRGDRPPSPARAVEVSVEPRTEQLGFREVEAGDVDITKAEFLLSVGRGIEDKDALPQFEELAETMGATLSVSRPLVDAGWVLERAPGRAVGQDRQAEGLPGARASPAPSSISPGCRTRTRSSRSTPTPRRRSSGSRTTGRSRTSSTSRTSWRNSSAARPWASSRRSRPRRPARSSGTSSRRSRCSGTSSPVFSVLVFAYGVARPVAKYRRSPRRRLAAALRAAGPLPRGAPDPAEPRLDQAARPLRRLGAQRRSSTASWCSSSGPSSSRSTPTSPSRCSAGASSRATSTSVTRSCSTCSAWPCWPGVVMMMVRRGDHAAAQARLRAPRPGRTRPGARGCTAIGDWTFVGILLILVVSGYVLEGARIAMDQPGYNEFSPAGWAGGAGLRGDRRERRRAAGRAARDLVVARAAGARVRGGDPVHEGVAHARQLRLARRARSRRPASACARSRPSSPPSRPATARSPTSAACTCSTSTRARSAGSATRPARRSPPAGRCRRATSCSSCASRRTRRCARSGSAACSAC